MKGPKEERIVCKKADGIHLNNPETLKAPGGG